MRVKVSITLPEELLKVIDQRARQQGTTRSDFIKASVQAVIEQATRAEENAHDLEIINRHAALLNREARDVLAYQMFSRRQFAASKRACFSERAMGRLARDRHAAKAVTANVTDDVLTVDLADGRTLSVPLTWYPRLVHGTPEERRNWRLIGGGVAIHWPDLNEDISIEGLLLGKRSKENERSLRRWLEKRE